VGKPLVQGIPRVQKPKNSLVYCLRVKIIELSLEFFISFLNSNNRNHDYGYGATGVQAQIDRNYKYESDDLWQTESTNYTKVFNIPSSDPLVDNKLQIIFVDTTTLAPSQNKCCNKNG
jgi:hypothetical protein